MNAIIVLIIALACVVTFQFYKGRKLNLLLMRHYLNEIESVIKPLERDYVWLGGYVGYRGMYKVSRLKGVETTLTLLPRQSMLYFPISLITSRHDKLYLLFKLKFKSGGEVHLIQRRYFRIKPKINESLSKEIVRIEDVEFEASYNDKPLLDDVVSVLSSLPNPRNIKQISIHSDVFYVFMKPEPENVKAFVKKLYEFACELSSHK